jgi:hypothetical protein
MLYPAHGCSFVKQMAEVMATKTTIAIIGATYELGVKMVNKLAPHNYRLLLISPDEDKLKQISDEVRIHFADAEVEAITCVKEGCWEAAIIMLAASILPTKELAQRIKDVATQKILVQLRYGNNASLLPYDMTSLQEMLPYSKILTVTIDEKASPEEITISGKDDEAVEAMITIARTVGFAVQTATA